jgi:hypothetical protein
VSRTARHEAFGEAAAQNGINEPEFNSFCTPPVARDTGIPTPSRASDARNTQFCTKMWGPCHAGQLESGSNAGRINDFQHAAFRNRAHPQCKTSPIPNATQILHAAAQNPVQKTV